MSEQIRESTLEAGVWLFGRFVFASLKEANNKLDMPRALRRDASRRPLIDRMGELTAAYDPDALWGVPSGGQEFAEELSETKWLGIPVISLVVVGKDANGKKIFGYASAADRKMAARYPRKVGIEDLTTELTSINTTLQLPELADGTVAIVAGCRRGTPDVENLPDIPVHWAFEFQVPNIITPGHPHFQRYGHLAIGDFVAM